MALSMPPPSQAPSEIQVELDRLMKSLDTVFEQQSTLTQRLASVLTPNLPSPVMPPQPMAPSLSPMANRIADMRSQVEGLTERTSTLLNQLAL